VLEDSGWNTHQFHSATEFYADFGVYDVRLTVPSAFVVGATGRQTAKMDNGDGSTLHRITAKTSTTSPGRPAPASSICRGHSRTHAAAGRDAVADAARASRSGRALLLQH
jgi:hypothetical protein